MATIATNLQLLRERIALACNAAGRPVQSVTLVAVAKTFSAAAIRDACALNQRRFAENYVSEALDKMTTLRDLRGQLEWHLIGPLQSNKTRAVAERFDWVHTIDRLQIASRLSRQRPSGLAPLQVCLQVNISGEPTKSGLPPGDIAALAHEVARLPNLCLRGLMAVPAPTTDHDARRRPYRALSELLRAVNQQGHRMDTLSMGMSADLEAAIAEGATIVRIGTAIFGAR